MAKYLHKQCTASDSELDRSSNMALDLSVTTAPGADEVDAAALSVAVEEDLGAVELYDDYSDWKRSYADSVGISRWREL